MKKSFCRILIFSVFLLQQEQQTSCTGKLQQTTGLIQFCIEALKETDSAAFLQVNLKLYNVVYIKIQNGFSNIYVKDTFIFKMKTNLWFVERLNFWTTELILSTQNNNNTLIGFGCFVNHLSTKSNPFGIHKNAHQLWIIQTLLMWEK